MKTQKWVHASGAFGRRCHMELRPTEGVSRSQDCYLKSFNFFSNPEITSWVDFWFSKNFKKIFRFGFHFRTCFWIPMTVMGNSRACFYLAKKSQYFWKFSTEVYQSSPKPPQYPHGDAIYTLVTYEGMKLGASAGSSWYWGDFWTFLTLHDVSRSAQKVNSVPAFFWSNQFRACFFLIKYRLRVPLFQRENFFTFPIESTHKTYQKG